VCIGVLEVENVRAWKRCLEFRLEQTLGHVITSNLHDTVLFHDVLDQKTCHVFISESLQLMKELLLVFTDASPCSGWT
jgi:hypothetical protein